ncbi:RNA polymerase sigma factor ShbA [Lentzea sp. BCCO 10_0856]|uniref:RNA polymerase sigma factor ShbA n=1 Tax=Lentzea miocenica TaxID=3095431 RepID=A0ABU4T9T8_9PSEU|nr:RNA polymerase sigma factor ShbA [Lentzea sp. BCCO 10_0856]MDX8034870.1 RNA polymerase sigma factor ShbA [Lentzea sp. BCCO 10_0856]
MPVPETELLERATKGDRAAVQLVLTFVRPVVVRYCRARLGWINRAYGSADDVTQEVCLAVVKALPTYRDEGRPFLAFVYGIASHKVSDAMRLSSRHHAEPVAQVPDGASAEVAPEDRVLRQELAERLSLLMEQLPGPKREILLLRVVLGLSAQETAEIIGCTPGAVRVAQHRALSTLREIVSRTRWS